MYDAIIIGAGSGGLGLSTTMNKLGLKVLLIDKSDKNIGGDCLNFGCVPSKALIHTARLSSAAHKAQRFGIKLTGSINLAKVAKYVNDKKEIIREHENATYLKKIGIDIILGEAKFSSKKSVIVNGKVYTGKKIIIATGSRPRKLEVNGLNQVKFHTNETIFNLKILPKKMVIIGGGPIGLELGQAFQNLGSQVSVVIRGAQFLPKEDPEIANILRDRLEKEGMKFLFNSTPFQFTANSVIVQDFKKNKTILKFDTLLVSIGRTLNIDKLDLEKGNIKLDENKKIIVDKYLRTTNKNVYVIGDAAGSYQFTHVAELHIRNLLNNFFSPIKKKISYKNLSWVTYTNPEIATFGLSEDMLKEKNVSYYTKSTNFTQDDRAIVDGSTYGKVKLFIGKNKKILGGTMIANNAGEIFQELVLANHLGLKTKEIFNKIYPYPTASRVNQQVIGNDFIENLTPLKKKILKWLY